MPAFKTSSSKVPRVTDVCKDQKKTDHSALEDKEQMESYKRHRGNLLQEKHKMETYQNPLGRLVRMQSSLNNKNIKHAKVDVEFKSDLSGEISRKGEIVKEDTEKDVKISMICLNKPLSKYLFSQQSLPEKLCDLSPQMPEQTDTKVSTHKVVLRLSNSCPPQGEGDSSSKSPGKVDASTEEVTLDMVNVKEIVSVFEPGEKELKINQDITLDKPLHTIAVPSSPNKIKNMAAMFEKNS